MNCRHNLFPRLVACLVVHEFMLEYLMSLTTVGISERSGRPPL